MAASDKNAGGSYTRYVHLSAHRDTQSLLCRIHQPEDFPDAAKDSRDMAIDFTVPHNGS